MHELRQHSEPNADDTPQGTGESAAQIVTAIQQAAQLIDSLLAADFSQVGVNNARFAALRYIGQSTESGCSQRDLAAALGQSESSVSGLVSRMRDDGLVYRLRSKQDQRKRQLMLSAQGRQMLTDCSVSYQRQIDAVLSRFESAWLDKLSRMLGELVGGMSNPSSNDTSEQTPPDTPARRSA